VNVVDGSLLQRFLSLAGERLRGDWVVIGGCVLPLRGVEHRATLDIDIAGPDTAGMSETLLLFGIAEELGLPVEAINQAGALFLRRVPDWESMLIEVHRGSTATIRVPDATLFLLLKLGRLSEVDLEDCLAMLKLVRDRGESFDAHRVRGRIRESMKGGVSEDMGKRLRHLQSSLPAEE
jgi:uncharacterized nucleotidyltransferase DUF6036